jgi:protein TonB
MSGGSRNNCICLKPGTNDPSADPPDINFKSGDNPLPFGSGPGKGNGPDVRLEEKQRPRISHIDEGLLTQKVMPVYPMIASRVGIQGDVILYAIIARDGSIQSLKLITGHPLLVAAAMDAVKQWKYKPYILNGEPVEVETYITVTFRKGN